MSIVDRVFEEMKRLHLTQQQLSALTDVAQSTLSKWKMGKGEPTYANIEIVAKAMGMTVSELAADGKSLSTLTPSQKEMFNKWDSLTEKQKKAVQAVIESYGEDE